MLKLKQRKVLVKEGTDWDNLLFAYLEAPQASTRFSPFELLYGHHVHGPLDILSKLWQRDKQRDKQSDKSVVSHILSMRSGGLRD